MRRRCLIPSASRVVRLAGTAFAARLSEASRAAALDSSSLPLRNLTMKRSCSSEACNPLRLRRSPATTGTAVIDDRATAVAAASTCRRRLRFDWSDMDDFPETMEVGRVGGEKIGRNANGPRSMESRERGFRA